MDNTAAIVIAILGTLATIFSGLFVYLKGRGETGVAESNAKNALDARIDERVTKQLEDAWVRIEALEKEAKESALEAIKDRKSEARRTLAMSRILRAIAKQWPNEQGPDLDEKDIAEIEDTIPFTWIRRKPTST